MSLFGDKYVPIPIVAGSPPGAVVFQPSVNWQNFDEAGVKIPDSASAVLITTTSGAADNTKFGFSSNASVAFGLGATSSGITTSTFVEGRDNLKALRFGRSSQWRVQFFRRRF